MRYLKCVTIGKTIVIEQARPRTTFDVMSCYYLCHALQKQSQINFQQLYNLKKILIVQVDTYAVHYLQARCVCALRECAYAQKWEGLIYSSHKSSTFMSSCLSPAKS